MISDHNDNDPESVGRTSATAYAPEQDDESGKEILERYYERRIHEIRSGAARAFDGFISMEELRAIADGEAPWPVRPR